MIAASNLITLVYIMLAGFIATLGAGIGLLFVIFLACMALMDLRDRRQRFALHEYILAVGVVITCAGAFYFAIVFILKGA